MEESFFRSWCRVNALKGKTGRFKDFKGRPVRQVSLF